MHNSNTPRSAVVPDVLDAVREARSRFRTIGWLLIVLGVIAIIFPVASSVVFKAMLGWFLLIAGAVMLWNAFQAKGWKSGIWTGLLGLLYIASGIYLAFFLFTGLIGITALMAALFLVQGVVEGVVAVQNRETSGWVWLLISAILSVVVGVMLVMSLPEAAFWALGLFTGINLLSTGVGLLALVRAAGEARVHTGTERSTTAATEEVYRPRAEDDVYDAQDSTVAPTAQDPHRVHEMPEAHDPKDPRV